MAPSKASRRVSFNSGQLPPSPSPSRTTTTNNNTPTRKSSLKSNTQSDRLGNVPKYIHTHPDPLLRRLRLLDPYGKEVDLKREFRDTKVVIFLFGASWSGVTRDYYTEVDHFAQRHPHRLKVIYVSVDTDESHYEANAKGKNWLAMEWNDGSNLPTDRTDTSVPLPPLAHNEDFLLASEEDLEHSLSHEDSTGTIYLRPFSRVHLAEKLGVLGIPSTVVYHLEKQKVIDSWIKKDMFHGPRGDDSWSRWQAGESVGFVLKDLVKPIRFIIFFLFIGLSAILIQAFLSGEETRINWAKDWLHSWGVPNSWV